MRHYLLQIITARVDTRISEYIFDRLLDIQIDYFERNPVGKIAHDLNEANKIRRFINEQGFGTALDSLCLLILLPVMFAFSPLLTFVVLGFSGLMVLSIIAMLPAVRRASGAVVAAETAKGTFLYQNLAGMRTVKSLALESRQRAIWDVLTVRVDRRAILRRAHRRRDPGDRSANRAIVDIRNAGDWRLCRDVVRQPHGRRRHFRIHDLDRPGAAAAHADGATY